MKRIFVKINVLAAIICILALISCDMVRKSAVKKKICGTWEVYSGTVYNKHDLKVIYPEGPFDEKLKWKLVINDEKITKPANNEYDDEQTANYELYFGDEAMEKGRIEKKHQRRAAGTDDDELIVLATNKKIIDERLFQIVNCTSDTLTIRFLSSSKFFNEHLYEYKLVRK